MEEVLARPLYIFLPGDPHLGFCLLGTILPLTVRPELFFSFHSFTGVIVSVRFYITNRDGDILHSWTSRILPRRQSCSSFQWHPELRCIPAWPATPGKGWEDRSPHMAAAIFNLKEVWAVSHWHKKEDHSILGFNFCFCRTQFVGMMYSKAYRVCF